MGSKSDYPSFSKTLILVMLILAVSCGLKYYYGEGVHNSLQKELSEYAKANGYSMTDYPDELVKALDRNEEMKEFIKQYPKYSDNFNASRSLDLAAYKYTQTVPFLVQWDNRWGYMNYNGGAFGLTGNAPTALSMAGMYLTNNTTLTPIIAADMAIDKGWENKPEQLLSNGARNWGIIVKQLPNGKDVLGKMAVKGEILKGDVIVATTDKKLFGGVVVIYDYDKDKGFSLNDPTSKSISEKNYTASELGKHIKKAWQYSVENADDENIEE